MDASPPNPVRRRWRARFGATALSLGAHAGLFAALLIGWGATATPVFLPAIDVALVAPFTPPAPKPPALNAHSQPKRAAPRKAPVHVAAAPRIAARPSPAPPVPESLPAAFVQAHASGDGAELSGDQLAGAQVAGDGDGAGSGGGGECNMARRVQAALRKDPLAKAAVHAAGGHAIMVWNGDWVQAGAEDGKGLAAVREAITWEVAFAPPECRRQRMRGLVLLSLNDGSPRLALGDGDWRWSDLLGLR